VLGLNRKWNGEQESLAIADDRAMRPIYKLFTLILFTLTATISLLCADFDSERNKLRKFYLFLQEWRFSRSRSSEVIAFGANRKRVCDFLLVRNSNLGPILHRFGDFAAFMCFVPHPCYTQFWGCSSCTRSPMLGSARAEALSYSPVKLLLKYSNLCEKHTSTSQTDGQTTYSRITVACRFMCVKFGLNRCTFPLVIAKCLGGSLCVDTVYITIPKTHLLTLNASCVPCVATKLVVEQHWVGGGLCPPALA